MLKIHSGTTADGHLAECHVNKFGGDFKHYPPACPACRKNAVEIQRLGEHGGVYVMGSDWTTRGANLLVGHLKGFSFSPHGPNDRLRMGAGRYIYEPPRPYFADVCAEIEAALRINHLPPYIQRQVVKFAVDKLRGGWEAFHTPQWIE